MYSLPTKYATRRPATTRTGPNDTSGVVWAISEFFFLIPSCYCILTNALSNYRCNLIQTMETGRSAMTGMGPNDAPCVIWAIASGKSGFYLLALERAYCGLMMILSPVKPNVTKPDHA